MPKLAMSAILALCLPAAAWLGTASANTGSGHDSSGHDGSGHDGPWSGSGELGLALASGNTDTRTLVGNVDLQREGAERKLSLGASFLYGSNDGRESAYRYELFGSSGRRLSERSYVFGSLRYQRDHFSTNEYQWAASAGYGLEAIENDDGHLTLEVGPGYRLAKLQGVRVHNNELILRGHLDFGRQLTGNTSVYNNFLVEAGSDNTYARNDLGVQVQMNASLALKAGLQVRHNTDVLPGIEQTDTLTTMNVVYGF